MSPQRHLTSGHVAVAAGELRYRVRIEDPHAPVPDGDGGFTDTPAKVLGVVSAMIEPASSRNVERLAAGTVISEVTHVVTMRYHAGVTTKSRIRYGTRVLEVAGVINVDERNVTTVALCNEIVP